MAATPTFASTPRTSVVDVSTANTNRDGTGTIATVITGVAAGTKIEEVVVKAAGTGAAPPNPADSIIVLFLHDGTSYHVYDELDMGDPAVASVTVESFRAVRRYDRLWLPNASWSLRASITVAMTAGTAMKVFASGFDWT